MFKSSISILFLTLCLIPTKSDRSLPRSLELENGRCWGYEDDCSWDDKEDIKIQCDPDVKGWNGEPDPRKTFFKQGDFGFLKERRPTIKNYCRPLRKDGSDLRCSDNLEFCTASNIAIDFRKISERVYKENLKYKMDIFSEGDIQLSGCELDTESLEANLEFMSPLQSWAPELRNIAVNDETKCDITFEEPVFITKLDASVNMYHHFCDFFNLYLSLHLNSSLDAFEASAWDTDKRVLILENSPAGHKSPFSAAWSAFTQHPVLELTKVAGKVVCFEKAVFPMLARSEILLLDFRSYYLHFRMIFGLYYNTPLIDGCRGSEMVRRFSMFMLERLGIKEAEAAMLPGDQRLRLTLIARQTRFRRIVNEAELVSALEQTGLYRVTVARFSAQVPFTSQLALTAGTDILAGLHGAGLTHLLFLPDWAEVVELYNCDDTHCYQDLARLVQLAQAT